MVWKLLENPQKDHPTNGITGVKDSRRLFFTFNPFSPVVEPFFFGAPKVKILAHTPFWEKLVGLGLPALPSTFKPGV